ncbi:MAG: hypothetical protein LBH62_06245 [Nitrososphaerota archaeon]|nr:hypothetical protein [Nitrososphaerota archaeon]
MAKGKSGAPSTTGNKSGTGRDNAPPKKIVVNKNNSFFILKKQKLFPTIYPF